MTYLDTLESELAAAGVPASRRRRIRAEFADHLHEDPSAELGAPRELARQFADELGTSLARLTAYRVFTVLALTGTTLAVMFLAAGRMRGLTFSAGDHTPTPGWAAPVLMIAMLAAQVALAAGGLALLRAWRLRRQPVISRAEAIVLARRSAVAGVSGVLAVAALPACALAFPRQAGPVWSTCAWIAAALTAGAMAAVLPSLLRGIRLAPSRAGSAGDLLADLGPWAPAGMTPMRLALLVCAAIVVVVTLAGAAANDGYDGLARGLADAIACLGGYLLLGRYLGLRTATPTGR